MHLPFANTFLSFIDAGVQLGLVWTLFTLRFQRLTDVVGKPCRLVRQLKEQEGQRRCRLDAVHSPANVAKTLMVVGGDDGGTAAALRGGGDEPSSEEESSEEEDDAVDDEVDDQSSQTAAGPSAAGSMATPDGDIALASPLAFANESQFLLTSESSMEDVRQYKHRTTTRQASTSSTVSTAEGSPSTYQQNRVDEEESNSIPVDRFRGNLVVAGGTSNMHTGPLVHPPRMMRQCTVFAKSLGAKLAQPVECPPEPAC